MNKHWKRISQEIRVQMLQTGRQLHYNWQVSKNIPKSEAASKIKLSQETGVVKCTHFNSVEKEVTNSPH